MEVVVPLVCICFVNYKFHLRSCKIHIRKTINLLHLSVKKEENNLLHYTVLLRKLFPFFGWRIGCQITSTITGTWPINIHLDLLRSVDRCTGFVRSSRKFLIFLSGRLRKWLGSRSCGVLFITGVLSVSRKFSLVISLLFLFDLYLSFLFFLFLSLFMLFLFLFNSYRFFIFTFLLFFLFLFFLLLTF